MGNPDDRGPFRPGLLPDGAAAATWKTATRSGRSTWRGWTGRPPPAACPSPSPGSLTTWSRGTWSRGTRSRIRSSTPLARRACAGRLGRRPGAAAVRLRTARRT